MAIFNTLNGIIGGGGPSIWFEGADGTEGRVTLDNGLTTWSLIGGNLDRSAFYGMPSNIVMGRGNSPAGVYRSTDGGRNFTFISDPVSGSNMSGFTADVSGNWIGVSQGADIIRSTDNGLSWSTVTNPISTNWNSVTNDGNGNYVAVANTSANIQIISSSDSGATWTDRSFTAAPTDNNLLDVSTDGTTWIATGQGGTIYKSTDAGVSWTAITSTPFGTNAVDFIQGVCNFNGTWIIVGKDTVFGITSVAISRSTDSGVTWSSFITNPGSNLTGSPRIGVGGDGLFMVTYREAPVHVSFTSKDEGLTWGAKVTTGLLGSQDERITFLSNTSGNT